MSEKFLSLNPDASSTKMQFWCKISPVWWFWRLEAQKPLLDNWGSENYLTGTPWLGAGVLVFSENRRGAYVTRLTSSNHELSTCTLSFSKTLNLTENDRKVSTPFMCLDWQWAGLNFNYICPPSLIKRYETGFIQCYICNRIPGCCQQINPLCGDIPPLSVLRNEHFSKIVASTLFLTVACACTLFGTEAAIVWIPPFLFIF